MSAEQTASLNLGALKVLERSKQQEDGYVLQKLACMMIDVRIDMERQWQARTAAKRKQVLKPVGTP